MKAQQRQLELKQRLLEHIAAALTVQKAGHGQGESHWADITIGALLSDVTDEIDRAIYSA